MKMKHHPMSPRYQIMTHRGRKIVSEVMRSPKRKRTARMEESSLETLERKIRGCALDENNFCVGVTHNGYPIQDLTREPHTAPKYIEHNGKCYMSLELAISLLKMSHRGK